MSELVIDTRMLEDIVRALDADVRGTLPDLEVVLHCLITIDEENISREHMPVE